MKCYHVVCPKCATEYVLDKGETAVGIALELQGTCGHHVRVSELTA